MARYNTIKYNDIANGPGIGISVYFQGCPFHCKGCFNQETWDFEGGKPFTHKTINEIICKIDDNNIPRHLSILGGEPLCEQNLLATKTLIECIRKVKPNIQIYIWTGFTLEELSEREANEPELRDLLSQIDVLVTDRYVEELRDISNPMCGSSNQEIIYYHRS